jgi:hypothetical protein
MSSSVTTGDVLPLKSADDSTILDGLKGFTSMVEEETGNSGSL